MDPKQVRSSLALARLGTGVSGSRVPVGGRGSGGEAAKNPRGHKVWLETLGRAELFCGSFLGLWGS